MNNTQVILTKKREKHLGKRQRQRLYVHVLLQYKLNTNLVPLLTMPSCFIRFHLPIFSFATFHFIHPHQYHYHLLFLISFYPPSPIPINHSIITHSHTHTHTTRDIYLFFSQKFLVAQHNHQNGCQ